jgi:hypothetical protein
MLRRSDVKKLFVLMTALACVCLQIQAVAQAPPAPAPPHAPCTRPQLQDAVDSYLAAQQAGDRGKMSFTEKPKLAENMNEIAPEAGHWNKAMPIAFSRSFLDVDRCKTFSEVIIISGGDRPYVIGTRLTVQDGKIAAIDSLVTRPGDWLFNAGNYLKFSSTEDWHPLKPAERIPKQRLIDAGNAYLDEFSDKFVDPPWGSPCARLEGGAYTDPKRDPKSTCKVGIPGGLLYIVNRDYVVDEELGVVNIFCRFGNSQTGMPDSHTFRLVNGKFRYVHTLSVANTGREVPQAKDIP